MIKQLCLIVLLFSLQVFAFKIQNQVREELHKTGKSHVFIILKQHVDFKLLEKTLKINLQTMDENVRGHLVVDSLKSVAQQSQKRILNFLTSKNIKFTPHWISNCIAVNADFSLIKELEKFSEIESIDRVDEAHLIDPVKEDKFSTIFKKTKKQTVEAGVQWIKAPEVWAKGFKGQGILVGVIDTGAVLHDDLKNFYRGRETGHRDSWLDATSLNRQAPYDDNFHGTHCHGTVSANGTRETVGVAVESEWISCKFLTRTGSGNYNDAVKCLEFMLAPAGDSNKRPHVVSNSYGGGAPTAAFQRGLEALNAAGVEMVFAAGNSGSRCSSMLLPANYPDALSVGALNRNSNQIAFFSSRGPGANYPKPEITAPGANVRSTSNTGGYRSASGTSMACPHVAGAIAVLWSADNNLKRNIDETRKVLYESATIVRSTLCSSRSDHPNNVYGHGSVNLLAAVELAESRKNAKSLNV